MAKKSSGLGQARMFKAGSLARDVVPLTVGTVLTLGTTLGIRAAITPTPGETSAAVYRWAPFIGMGAGLLGSVAMYLLGGQGPATGTATASVVNALSVWGLERLTVAKPGAILALAEDTERVNSGELAITDGGMEPPAPGTSGLRAIVPEYTRGIAGRDGLNAIVMEKLKGNEQHAGADVQLQGVVDQSAFGTKPFN